MPDGGGKGENTFNVNSGKETTEATTENDDSSSPAGPPTEQPPTTSFLLKVLVVGDSHIAYGTGVNPFGRELHRLLRTTGAQVQSYGSGGSTAYPWMKNKALVTTTDTSRSYEIDEQGQEIKLSENMDAKSIHKKRIFCDIEISVTKHEYHVEKHVVAGQIIDHQEESNNE